MSVEDNKTIIRRYFEECVDQGNFEVYHTSFAPHLKYHVKGQHTHSHGSYLNLLKEFHQGIVGRDVRVDALIGEGDQVVARWSIVGKHSGHFRQHAPTHEKAELEGALFARFEQGKVAEIWTYFEGPQFDYSPK